MPRSKTSRFSSRSVRTQTTRRRSLPTWCCRLPAMTSVEELLRISKVASARSHRRSFPPGVAWPAWMIASEIARRLGADLGFDSLEAIQDEIAVVAPSHRGLTAEALAATVSSATASWFRCPRPRSACRPSRKVGLIDPIATPGVASVEAQGAPLRVGSTESAPSATIDLGTGARRCRAAC